MAKRDAKIELMRVSIAHELDNLRSNQPPRVAGRTVAAEDRRGTMLGLQRAIEIIDRIDEQVS